MANWRGYYNAADLGYEPDENGPGDPKHPRCPHCHCFVSPNPETFSRSEPDKVRYVYNDEGYEVDMIVESVREVVEAYYWCKRCAGALDWEDLL